MTDIESIAQKTIDSYVTAVRERDTAAFMSLYARGVRIFDAWDAWEYRGAEQWQKPISAWLASHGSEKLRVTFDDVAVHGSQTDLAVTALVTYAQISADGALLGALRNRLTWFLQVRDGRTQIVHEHTSVPVDFHEMKPLTAKNS